MVDLLEVRNAMRALIVEGEQRMLPKTIMNDLWDFKMKVLPAFERARETGPFGEANGGGPS